MKHSIENTGIRMQGAKKSISKLYCGSFTYENAPYASPQILLKILTSLKLNNEQLF